MLYLLIILSFAISVFLSWLIIPRILVVAFRKHLFDTPNERKIHRGSVPRLGGLSFVPTIFFSIAFILALRYRMGYCIPVQWIYIVVPEFCFLICGLTLLYLSGIKDDLIGLRYRTKFVIQIVVASFFPLSGLLINNLYGLFGIYELNIWISIPFTVFAVVFITNAINLMDGIDGLASALSSITLLVLGGMFLSNQLWLYATLAFSTFGVLLPFFYYNVFGQSERCKKIFMGDTGSLTLGYILSFLAIRYAAYNPNLLPYKEGAFIISFSTLLVPMFDVVRVMLVRWRTYKGLFEADKNHIHHKFLAMGVSLRKTMLSLLGIACFFALANIVLLSYVNINIIFVFDVIVWIGMNMIFDKIRNKKQISLPCSFS